MDVESLPIDIHCGKLLDWLLSRRHCAKEWQQSAYHIREKINSAIQDMPENEQIVQLLSGTYINYYHCKEIVEILKQTEADSKNIFGYYSSQRMKDWQEIVSLYERENVGLAEAAQILQRFVHYEIPGLKRQIAKCHSTAEECVKKEADYERQARDAAKQFHAECVKMGLSTADCEHAAAIRRQLVRLAADTAAAHLHAVAANSALCRPAADYYLRFRQYALCRSHAETDKLTMLQFVMNRGDATVYEWRHGEKPTSVESVKFDVDQDEVLEDTIDFGDDLDTNDDEGIDFGDIEVLDEPAVEDVAQTVSASDGVARGDDALTVLENAKTQQLFVQDLMELEAFLKVRLLDVSTEHASDYILAGQRARHTAALELTSLSQQQLDAFLQQVGSLLGQLADPYKKHLVKIRRSTQYLEKLVDELNGRGALSGRASGAAAVVRERQAEASRDAVALSPRLALLAAKTKQLQAHIEKDISIKYKNRPVNIMGGAATA